MNVLQLVSCRGWSSDAYWATRVSRELERRGHTVTLGCRAGTEAKVIGRARREGLGRIDVFAFATGVRATADAGDLRHLGRALREAHVVHVHRGKEHWLAAIANRVTGLRRPLVRTRHIVQAVRSSASNRWLYRRATDAVITVSDAIRGQYIASGLLPEARVMTLHGGVDAELFCERAVDPALRARLGGIDGEPLVGMVAGFRAMKGHATVVDATARLEPAGQAPHVVFVGQGRDEDRIRALVKDRGVAARITVAGFAPDVPEVMASLDVGLYVPLESEGMSRVVFEYLATGRALVASRTGAVPEILHDGEDALLVPAGDAAALAEAIGRLVRDPALRTRLGRAGRRLVETHYSGARVAERLEALYETLVTRRDR